MATNVSELLDIGAHWPGNITAGVNFAAKTFINADGTLPASAAACTGGVVVSDTASGNDADVKIAPGIYVCVATGTVTKGLLVELLQASVYGNIAGVQTAITAAGVSVIASGVAIGRAITGGVAGDNVLVNLSVFQRAVA